MNLRSHVNDRGVCLQSQWFLLDLLPVTQVDANQASQLPDGLFELLQALIVQGGLVQLPGAKPDRVR